MKYLTIMPDYTGSCIWDECEGNIPLDTLKLPPVFLDRLNAWNNAYKKIIPLNEEKRKEMALEIERLDKEGLLIVENLKQLSSDPIKIRYFSEGKGIFID